MSPPTVGNHIKSIDRKLAVGSRSDAIHAGRRACETQVSCRDGRPRADA
ncbi:hypothetical protein [Sphingomonas lacunae]